MKPRNGLRTSTITSLRTILALPTASSQAFYKQAQVLADFPEMGHKYREVAEGDIRILLYGHYRIAYLIKGSDQIDIIGVFHGALDIDKYFP